MLFVSPLSKSHKKVAGDETFDLFIRFAVKGEQPRSITGFIEADGVG
jgi:hypothetical protein